MSEHERRTTRRLAAIVIADVVHYSKQMEADEVGTLERLRRLRSEVLDPAMRTHGGRLVKLLGDGLLAEFASAIEAASWAVSVQRQIAARNAALPEERRMTLRIGVNLGDVILEDDDIYGDGVNVAARIEPLSPRGGVCLSAAVHDHVQGRIEATFVSRGEHRVKNIARPIAIWCWSPDGLDEGASVPFSPREHGRKPTLAVRPFEAAGTGEDVRLLALAVHDATVGSLSNLSGITVLSDPARADFVASATIQAAGTRYRATVRLADNRNGEQFWSDRFDGDLSELFDAQDDLAYRVSQALRFSVYDREVAETERIPATERTTEQILARIGQTIAGSKRHEWKDAGEKLEAILLARPTDSGALAMKAGWHLYEVYYGWREPSEADRAGALENARLAVRHNRASDFAHFALSTAHLYCEHDTERAQREAERALELSPYYALGRFALGLARVFGGDADEGFAICAAAVQGSPRMVHTHRVVQAGALGAFLAGRFDEAVEWAHRSDHQVQDVIPTLVVLAASAASGGRPQEARAAVARVLAQAPEFRIAEMRRWPFRRREHLDRFSAALVAAGFPE